MAEGFRLPDERPALPSAEELASKPCPPEIIALAEALGRMLARRDHAAEERARNAVGFAYRPLEG